MISLRELELEGDLDLVGDEELAAAEDGAELHAELLAIDRGLGRESRNRGTGRIGAGAVEFGVEDHVLRHAAHRQVAFESELVTRFGLMPVEVKVSFGC